MAAQGVLARVLSDIAADGGLSGIDIANAVDVSNSTVSRWRSGQMRPQPRHELILSDLRYVVGRLQEFYSAEEVRAWLYARHPQLEGERAIDLIHDDRTAEVLAVLDRLDSSAYL
jgi:transcriptional regulator with XRE-family HTH domain